MLEMRSINKCDMEKFGTLDCSKKTIAILRDRCWPQTAKQDEHKINKTSLYAIRKWKKHKERPSLGVSIWKRNGAPSLKGCVVNGPNDRGKQQ